jgi:3-oxoacyl-[acyl-carrier protein] reductase
VHAAGDGPVAPLLETTEAMWAETLGGKLMGTIRLTRAVAAEMVSRRSGRVVIVNGVFCQEPDPNFPINSTVNCGLAGFAKAISRDLGRQGVRVNVVKPGATTTPLSTLHASLRDRVQSAAAAPAWSALASSWAAASGQSASDVLAQLAVTVSQPAAATPVPDRGAVNAGVLAGAVVGAVVLLGLLVACGLAAITRQRAKYRTGLGLPVVVMWGVTGPSSGSGDPRVI